MDYDTLASVERINRAIVGLKSHNIRAEVVDSGVAALARIKELIPKNVSVMNGTSRTLEQIGYIDYLKAGTHEWDNLKENIVAEKDPVKQAELRKHSVVSEYYLGSVHALAENGDIVVASASGSQLPHVVFTSQNLIFVVSTKKIVPTLADAFDRIEKHVFPLEDARMQEAYGGAHSVLAKILILKAEPAMMKRTVQVLLVNENLGF